MNKYILLTLLCLTGVCFLIFGFTGYDPKSSDYNVIFKNNHWNNLHLQVRVGNQSVPENNPMVQDVYLKKGESVAVGYDVLCYYRRDADPDKADGRSFTGWTSTGCFRGKACVVENP